MLSGLGARGRAAAARLGPRRGLITVVALVGGAFLLGTGLIRLETRWSGVSGSFRAEHCEVTHSRHSGDSWLCTGSFDAGDDSFRIAKVEVDTSFDEPPAGPVAATVDNRSSAVAVEHRLGAWLAPAGTGLLCLGVAAGYLVVAFRPVRQSS